MSEDRRPAVRAGACAHDPAVPPPWRRWGPGRQSWSPGEVPDLSGRIAVVTGAGRGIGLAIAEHLARHGAELILAGKCGEEAAAAAGTLRRRVPQAHLESVSCDLGDLGEVREAARRITRLTGGRLDILINNAGVAALPPTRSTDGYETHFAVNHLGHFALTGRLLPALLHAPEPRVVNVTSVLHWLGRFRPHHVLRPSPHRRWTAYFDSKLANLLFTHGLHTWADVRDLPLRSLAAHPGLVNTTLGSRALRTDDRHAQARALEWLQARWHCPEQAALSLLRAATDPHLVGGTLVGPGGRWEWSGPPVQARAARRAGDPHTVERLWRLSQRLTDHPFPAAAHTPVSRS